MSLQDDIFDVQDAVKDNQVIARAFERITTALNDLDIQNENLSDDNSTLKKALKIFIK